MGSHAGKQQWYTNSTRPAQIVIYSLSWGELPVQQSETRRQMARGCPLQLITLGFLWFLILSHSHCLSFFLGQLASSANSSLQEVPKEDCGPWENGGENLGTNTPIHKPNSVPIPPSKMF